MNTFKCLCHPFWRTFLRWPKLLSWLRWDWIKISSPKFINHMTQSVISGWSFMWGRDCFKTRFHKLIQYRNPPFKMWNLITKLFKRLFMSKSIQVIKLSLNNIFSLGRLKKYHIYRYYKHLINFIIETIQFRGIWVPQEDTFVNPCTEFVSLFLRYQGITSGTKNPEMSHQRNVAIPHFIGSLIFYSIRWTHIIYTHSA